MISSWDPGDEFRARYPRMRIDGSMYDTATSTPVGSVYSKEEDARHGIVYDVAETLHYRKRPRDFFLVRQYYYPDGRPGASDFRVLSDAFALEWAERNSFMKELYDVKYPAEKDEKQIAIRVDTFTYDRIKRKAEARKISIKKLILDEVLKGESD